MKGVDSEWLMYMDLKPLGPHSMKEIKNVRLGIQSLYIFADWSQKRMSYYDMNSKTFFGFDEYTSLWITIMYIWASSVWSGSVLFANWSKKLSRNSVKQYFYQDDQADVFPGMSLLL